MQLQKVLVRPVSTRRGDLVQFVSRYAKRDEARNLNPSESAAYLADLFSDGFRSGHLFTTGGDFQIVVSKKGRSKLTRSAPTFRSPPDTAHDRASKTPLDPSRKYLKLLGITTSDGKVRDKKQAKYRQTGRFVSILDGLLGEAGLKNAEEIEVVDMGSGKAYLTFSLYDHLTNAPSLRAKIVGIEEREELVRFCSGIARRCGYEGLRFEQGTISGTDIGSPDVLIALHACDTATDDAIFRGIEAGAKIIVAAPCCQKELRSQLRFPAGSSPLNEFGLIQERETESVTDAIRALLLKHKGYKVRMLEFVSPEHTPKNNLITAVLANPPVACPLSEAESVMEHYGIAFQKLHSLLTDSRIAD